MPQEEGVDLGMACWWLGAALAAPTARQPSDAPRPTPVPNALDAEGLIASSGICSDFTVDGARIQYHFHPEASVTLTDAPFSKAVNLEEYVAIGGVDYSEVDVLVNSSWTGKNLALLTPTSSSDDPPKGHQDEFDVTIFMVEKNQACGEACVHYSGQISTASVNFVARKDGRFLCRVLIKWGGAAVSTRSELRRRLSPLSLPVPAPVARRTLFAPQPAMTSDDACVDKWWCQLTPPNCQSSKAADCPNKCAEECQPCIDEHWYCAPWLCSVTGGASCRKSCAEHCQVNCLQTPESGECRAKEVACTLSKQLEGWTSKNANITLVQKQLRELCKGGQLKDERLRRLEALRVPMGLSAEAELQQDAVALETSACDEDTEKCATNVALALASKSWLVKQAFLAPGWLAKSGVDTLKEVLKASATIALRGTIAFAFVSAGVSAFFPKLGQDPKSPCDGLQETNWAKCVWAQIFPLVEEFVDAKIDNLVEELWKAKLEGWNNGLWYIIETVAKDTGTKKEVPEDVAKKMVGDLERLHQGMIQDAPQFMLPFSQNKVAGLYFSQFAALHFSVMTSILSGDEFRTEGFRWTSQDILLCYAQQAVHKSLQARDARLKALEVSTSCGNDICCAHPSPGLPCLQPCRNICHEYKDTWQDCNWSPGKCHLKTSVTCGPPKWPLAWSCIFDEDTCPSSTEAKRWECHLDFVSEQMDEIWSTWLTPVPLWLQWIGQLDAMRMKTPSTYDSRSGFSCPLT